MAAGAQPSGGRGRGALDPYVPRVLLRHLADEPHAPFRVVEGSAVMADVSGFTKLSERLARLGREGAEELVETINACFSSLLAVAYENGGSLLKFGGDALLLLFEGPDHAARACRSALGMRRRLREAGPIRTTGGQVSLRMSQGVHTGAYHLFLVGGSHRELLVGGPAATAVVATETVAGAGEVVMSEATARCLPARCAGAAKGAGVLVAGAPAGEPLPIPLAERMPPLDAVAGCLSTEVRAHVLSGRRPPPEHRTVTVAFVKYGGTDALLEREGAGAVAAALDRVVRAVQEAVDARHVCFLQSDVDADGGKIVLTAGAPRATGDDEERMLLAVREILDADLPLPVRVGVNRGSVFCGDVGPEYRRTYSTMGDAVNLAARLMAAAPWGECYATPLVLDRSPTAFASAMLAPLRVKGKAKPVEAVTLGHPVAARSRDHIVERFPLVGRDRELGVLRAALADATGGPRTGRVVEIAGERGIGKTRLLEELRENAGEVRRLGVACEAYTAVVPYAPWRSLLRQVLGLGPDAPAARVLPDLRAAVGRAAPDLAPWLPLLAIPLGIELPPTPEVRELAPRFRAARLHEVTRRLLVALLPVPALLEVEAAHHMDRASADLLAAVTADLDGVPWLVVVTRRDTGAGFRLPDRAGHVHLEPGPLDPDDTLALAERVTESAPLPPHVVRLAAARSAGNPQFLRDLLRAADTDPEAPLPDSIETAAMARIDRLRQSDRTLIRRAAVLGQGFDEPLLGEVLEDEVPPPDEATWQRLWRYFERDGEHVRFRRSVVREVAYAALPFRTRRRLHGAVADRLRRDAGVDVDEQAAILSLHLHRAGRDDAAWRFARLAGDRAREQYAYADAATLYRRALDAARTLDVAPLDLAGVWVALADARARTGELDAAHEALTAARRLTGDDPLRQAGLLLRHARVSERAGLSPAAVRWILRALRLLDGFDNREALRLRARLTALLGTVRQRQGRSRDAARICREAIALAEATGEDEALAHACFVHDWALGDVGLLENEAYSRRALRLYSRLGELDRQGAVLNNMGIRAYLTGDWDRAIGLYRRAADASLRAGDTANAAYGDVNIGEALADQGRFEDAEVHVRAARRVWRGSGYTWGTAYATALLGRTAVRAGRPEEGVALLEEARADFARIKAHVDCALTEAFLAEAHAFACEPEDALAMADRLLEHGDARWGTPLLHRIRGCALAQLGDRGAARIALELSVDEATRAGNDYEVAVSLDALDALIGDDDLGARARRRQRDAVLRRLHVAALPRPPVDNHRARLPAAVGGTGPAAPRAPGLSRDLRGPSGRTGSRTA